MITKPKTDHWYIVGFKDYIDLDSSKKTEFIIEITKCVSDNYFEYAGTHIYLGEVIIISEVKIPKLPKSTVNKYMKILTAREDAKKSNANI